MARVVTERGAVVDLAVARAPELIGHVDVMHGGERGCDAVAVDAATVVTIPASAFEEMLHASPATLRTLAANFARIIRLAVVIDGYKLANLLVVSSLSPSDIAPLPGIIDNLARGDGSLAAQRLATGVPPSGVTSYGLALGVFCSEHAAFTSREQVVDAGRAVLPGFPDAVLALSPQAPYILGDCAQWGVPAAAATVAAPVTSDVPVLIVSGALDAITAPPNGQTVASGLRNAISVEFADAAHDVMLWSPSYGVAVLRSFLSDPATLDRSCVSSLPASPTFR